MISPEVVWRTPVLQLFSAEGLINRAGNKATKQMETDADLVNRLGIQKIKKIIVDQENRSFYFNSGAYRKTHPQNPEQFVRELTIESMKPEKVMALIAAVTDVAVCREYQDQFLRNRQGEVVIPLDRNPRDKFLLVIRNVRTAQGDETYHTVSLAIPEENCLTEEQLQQQKYEKDLVRGLGGEIKNLEDYRFLYRNLSLYKEGKILNVRSQKAQVNEEGKKYIAQFLTENHFVKKPQANAGQEVWEDSQNRFSIRMVLLVHNNEPLYQVQIALNAEYCVSLETLFHQDFEKTIDEVLTKYTSEYPLNVNELVDEEKMQSLKQKCGLNEQQLDEIIQDVLSRSKPIGIAHYFEVMKHFAGRNMDGFPKARFSNDGQLTVTDEGRGWTWQVKLIAPEKNEVCRVETFLWKKDQPDQQQDKIEFLV